MVSLELNSGMVFCAAKSFFSPDLTITLKGNVNCTTAQLQSSEGLVHGHTSKSLRKFPGVQILHDITQQI